MKPLLVLFLLLAASNPCQNSQSKPLSNTDVLQMSQAGLAPETIVAKIRASETTFDTSPSALADLKSKGISDAVLQAMIGSNPIPALRVTETAQAQEVATKALRRLANAVEMGVSYVEYSPLVAEAKTELDTALTKIPDGPFRRSALRAMEQYQFAATVWQALWRDDYVTGAYKDIAINQYGVKERGWLKTVWRIDFLSAIWREARRHYEAVVYPEGVGKSNLTPTERLVGSWRLQIGGQPSDSVWYLIIHDKAQTLGSLQIGSSNYALQSVSLSASRFTISTKKRDSTEIKIQVSVEDDTMRGTIEGVHKKQPINGDLIGKRDH